MQPNQPARLDLRFMVPTISYDGIVVNITSNGIPSVAFFQRRKQDEQAVQADVVASIRFNSIDELKDLQKTIQETIDNNAKREA